MDDILANGDNLEHITLLQQKLDKNENIAVFVGAGASKVLGIKTWAKVLEEMNKEFGVMSEKDLENRLKMGNYPNLASEIYKEIDDGEYNKFLSRQFKPKASYHYSLHTKILTVFDIILTTNYDTSFENAFKDLDNYLKKCECTSQKKIMKQKLPHFDASQLHLDPTIVYLHGNDDDGIYIFKDEDYKDNYPNNYEVAPISDLENFLRDIFQNFSLVFIGFSFEDKDFIEFFKKIFREFDYNKKKFEDRHNMPYSKEFPTNFGIFTKKSLKSTVSKKEFLEKYGDIPLLNNLFTNPTEDELQFKSNIEKSLDGLISNADTKNKILELITECKDKENKKSDFNDINLKIISIDDYIQIETVLSCLINDVLKVKKSPEPT
jgi:hypothetical protein